MLTALMPLCGPLQSHRRVYPNQANNTIPTPINEHVVDSSTPHPVQWSGRDPVPSEMSPEAAAVFTISSHHTSPLDCNLITHLAQCLRIHAWTAESEAQRIFHSATVDMTAPESISASQA